MVTKTYVSIPPAPRKRDIHAIPALISSTESESVSTLGMHDIAIVPTELAAIQETNHRPISLRPISSEAATTPLRTNATGGQRKHRIVPLSNAKEETRMRAPGRAGNSMTKTLLHHQIAPVPIVPSSRQTKYLIGRNENFGQRKEKNEGTKKVKKDVIRDPHLQAALERNQRRQRCDAIPRIRPHTDYDMPLYPGALALPSLEFRDDYDGRYQPRRHHHQHKSPRSRRVTMDHDRVKELRDVVDIFSEYEGILDRLVHKHAKLQSYVEADKLPRDFISTKDVVRERLEDLRRARQGEMLRQWKSNQALQARERHGRPKLAKPVSTSTFRQEVRPDRAFQSVSRSKSANPTVHRQNDEQMPQQEEKNRPKSAERPPKYGRNEGFIHGHDLKPRLSELMPSFGVGSGAHRKNSHLLYRKTSAEEEPRDPSNPDALPQLTKKVDNPQKLLAYEKASRIEKLREELAQLREKRKASLCSRKKISHLEDHLREKRNDCKNPATQVRDPLPARPVGNFCAPASLSSIDPAGGHYNPLTTATKIQPIDRRVPQRLDAPGPTIDDVKGKLRFPQISNTPCMPRQQTPPDCEPTIVRHDDPSSTSIKSPNPPDSESKEDSLVVAIHETLSRDRQRIEEIERRVMESKDNHLDEELEKEILRMSPFHNGVDIPFTDDKSLPTSDDDDFSSGTFYDTDSYAEVKNSSLSKVQIRSSIHPNLEKKNPNSPPLRSSKRLSEQRRRDAFLGQLARKRKESHSSLPFSSRLSELMPASSQHEFHHSDKLVSQASSLTSTDDESEEPKTHFLPVSSSNRGQWQSYVKVHQENQLEAMLSSFLDTAKQFLSTIDITNTFSRELQNEQDRRQNDREEIQDCDRVSFDTLNERARTRGYAYESEGDSDNDDYQNMAIKVVESEDGMIHINPENSDIHNVVIQVENSWGDESEFDDDNVNDDVFPSSHQTATQTWARSGEHLLEHQKYFLETASSYKDPQEFNFPAKEVLFETEFDDTVTKEMNRDDDSDVHENGGGRYIVCEEKEKNKPDQGEKEYNVCNEKVSSENDPGPKVDLTTETPVSFPPPRNVLRQMSSNLLSSDSSASTENDSKMTTALQNLVKDSDDDDEDTGQKCDRYSPGPGAPPQSGSDWESTEERAVARPPQFKRQIDPPTNVPPQSSVIQLDRPQEEKAAVVLSPRGSAIEFTKNENSWKNPFNFWG